MLKSKKLFKRLTTFFSLIILVSIPTACSSVNQSVYEETIASNEALLAEVTDKDSEIEELSNTVTTLEKEAKELNSTIDSLQQEIDSLNKKYEPYVSLSEAEIEAKRAEKELAAKKAQKELEEIETKEAEEKLAKEKSEKEAKETKEKLGYETGITYEDLARTPDDYVSNKVKFSGKVIQVIDGEEEIQIRLAVNEDYDTILYCGYYPDIVSYRVLEDDIITIYGTSLGLTSYQSTIGGTITIPAIWIEKIDQ